MLFGLRGCLTGSRNAATIVSDRTVSLLSEGSGGQSPSLPDGLRGDGEDRDGCGPDG
jgi:hypothetical protein